MDDMDLEHDEGFTSTGVRLTQLAVRGNTARTASQELDPSQYGRRDSLICVIEQWYGGYPWLRGESSHALMFHAKDERDRVVVCYC